MAFWLGTVSTVYSYYTIILPLTTELYEPKSFFTHAALLRQAFAHCGRFPTAASRRSLDRVSVPNVAVHPLRPATDRRLGGPLPLQLANQTQTPPPADSL